MTSPAMTEPVPSATPTRPELRCSLAAPLRDAGGADAALGRPLPPEEERLVDLVLVACELSDDLSEIAELVDTAIAADRDPSLAPVLPSPSERALTDSR